MYDARFGKEKCLNNKRFTVAHMDSNIFFFAKPFYPSIFSCRILLHLPMKPNISLKTLPLSCTGENQEEKSPGERERGDREELGFDHRSPPCSFLI